MRKGSRSRKRLLKYKSLKGAGGRPHVDTEDSRAI